MAKIKLSRKVGFFSLFFSFFFSLSFFLISFLVKTVVSFCICTHFFSFLFFCFHTIVSDLITVDFQLRRHGVENIKGGDVAEKAQPVHSASYPFAKEEKWWAYLLYHLPKDPNAKAKKGESPHKRLLLTQVITAQDRLDSEPIYAEIDELLQNLKIAKKREDEEDEKKAAEKEARREVKRSKNPEYDSDEDSDDEEDDGYEDRVFDKCESLVIEDKIEKLRKSLPTRFKFRGPDKPDTYKFTVVRYDLLFLLLLVVVVVGVVVVLVVVFSFV